MLACYEVKQYVNFPLGMDMRTYKRMTLSTDSEVICQFFSPSFASFYDRILICNWLYSFLINYICELTIVKNQTLDPFQWIENFTKIIVLMLKG